MVITLGPELENALIETAQRERVTPEQLVIATLAERFLTAAMPFQPRDDWERQLLGLATDCGVSLSDATLSREELYD